MRYCTACGNPLHPVEETRGLCTPCEAKSGVDAAAEGMEAREWRSYVTFIRSHFASPDTSIAKVGQYRGYLPGAFAAALSALVLSIILLIYTRQLIGLFYSFVGGGLFDFGMTRDIPYFSMFIRFILLFLLQWAVLSGILLGGAKVLKATMTSQQAFNLAGIAKLYVAGIAFAAMVAGFIHFSLGLAIFVGGYLLSFLMLHNGLKTIMQNVSSYYLPAIISIYIIVQYLLLRMLF